jgi:4-hydroxythreonine-4-phosphate dehydrogenase
MHTIGKSLGSPLKINPITDPGQGIFKNGTIDMICVDDLDPAKIIPGYPDKRAGIAMIKCIETAVSLCIDKKIDGMVTAPVNKTVMKLSGSDFHGHTELIASRTKTDKFAMMMTGKKLKVVLVTIHVPLKKVPDLLTPELISEKILLTANALRERFGIKSPAIAVAGLNPHAGEEGMFGTEEDQIILPAINALKNRFFSLTGPLPPDTAYFQAANGRFDAVISMYHDQGLIPFKMIHFKDGVNTTIGLPIIRTSVDHGTAYDIAGKGIADEESLVSAIISAAEQSMHQNDSLKRYHQ